MPAKRSSLDPGALGETRHRLQRAVQRRAQKQRSLEARVRVQEARIAELGEALRHGERHKGEFLATMSHELRTPLNVVLGFASLLYDEAFGPLSPQQLQATEKVLESAERLGQLINDLLDTARLDQGTLQFELDRVDLAGLTRDALEAHRPLAEGKSLAIHSELPEGLPLVCADALRLRQVLDHLLENAVKFTPAGGAIGVRAQADLGARRVVVEVWDSGIGIPAEAMHRLFERFYQVDSSNTREYGGTGLGLAIVKEFVERLGGDVGVDSEIGRGSTFKLSLPAAEAR